MAKYHVLKRARIHGHVTLPGDIVEEPTGAQRLIDRGFVIRVHEDTPVTIDIWSHEGQIDIIGREAPSTDEPVDTAPSDESAEPTQSDTTEDSVDSSEAGSSSEEESTTTPTPVVTEESTTTPTPVVKRKAHQGT